MGDARENIGTCGSDKRHDQDDDALPSRSMPWRGPTIWGMRVLVTGSSGHLGEALVRVLTSEGYRGRRP